MLTDEWLYLYVLELTALDRRVEAIDSLARLATEFPHSRFLPHLELVVAFHELTHGQLLRARRLFAAVLAGPARELHALARAGLGWSFLRAAPDAPLRADLALDNFFHSYKATRPGDPADPTLRTSREHGLVHAFAAAARPDRAAEFFKKLVDTPGERREAALLERLALAYFARGEHRESATIYRALLASTPTTRAGAPGRPACCSPRSSPATPSPGPARLVGSPNSRSSGPPINATKNPTAAAAATRPAPCPPLRADPPPTWPLWRRRERHPDNPAIRAVTTAASPPSSSPSPLSAPRRSRPRRSR